MDDLKLIRQLKQSFTEASLNEADTRYQIIDSILKDVLKWPLKSTSCEVRIEGNRADYVLKARNQKPILVIESKKIGNYFRLPENLNSDSHFQKILVAKLLTDTPIKEAINQAKEYCEDLGCKYGCICNGFQWIFFSINASNGPWKQQPAYVIKSLDYFLECYTTAINIFGYTNMVDKGSLKQNVGLSRKLNLEIFYPKSSITAYDMPVNSNSFANTFNAISRKYLGPIPFDDKEFFEECYVTNKGNYDSLQKNVQGLLYDSITPFFKREGVKNIVEDRKGGSLVYKIEEIMRKENLDNVIILFGGRGSGKSTFIKRLLFHLRPPEIEKHSVVALVDLLYSTQDPDDLSKEIWNKVISEIDKDNLLKKEKKDLLELFSDKFEIYNKQILQDFDPLSVEYKKMINDFLQETLNDKKYCSQIVSRYWKKKSKGLIIVLDNLDQLRPELQDVSFLTSIEIAKKLSCLVIISMREERYYNAKSHGVLDAYLVPSFHITSPVVPDVLTKRLIFIQEKIRKYREVRMDLGMINPQINETVISFLGICLREVIREDSDLSKFLRFSTHGDVRQALDFFKDFLTSGYTNVSEMAAVPSWKFQIHQVIKPMMIPNRFFYNEKQSKVPNIYQIRNDINSSHFTGLRILNILDHRSYDRPSSGFIDARYLVQKFESDFDLKIDCENNLSIFLSKGIIESNNRLEEYSQDVDQVRITSFGKYILDYLAFSFTYLDLICLDCGLFDESVANFLIDASYQEIEFYHERLLHDRVISRLSRVEEFIRYLKKQEDIEFLDLSLPSSEKRFCGILMDNFSREKEFVLKSSLNNKK